MSGFFSLPISCLRSDPAQQPAPEAPEGGAPGGAPPGQATNVSSNRRLQQTQAQMKEVGNPASRAGFL